MVYFSDLGNLFLIFFLGNRIFGDKRFPLPLLIYAFNPWAIYQTAFLSPYVFFLFLVLIIVLGLVLSKDDRFSMIFVFIASFLGMISSPFFLFILLLFCFMVFIFPVSNYWKKLYRLYLSFFFIFAILLFSLVFMFGRKSFLSVFKEEATVFSDPGFINMINTYRGESVKEGFGFISKLVENKYFLGFEFFILKVLQNLTPATFFSPQEKMFGFSFSPPLFFGFLVPFFYGIYRSVLSKKKYLLLGLVLLLPSLLSVDLINIDRMVIFFPILIYLITYGFFEFQEANKRNLKLVLFLCVFLIVFQFVFVLYDIQTKEKERFIRYYGSIQEVKLR